MSITKKSGKKAGKAWEAAWESFLEYVTETDQILNLSMTGIRNLEGMVRLKEVLKRDPKEIEKAKVVEALALAERDRGFPLHIAHSLVSLWSALESAVLRFAPEWLALHPAVLEGPAFAKVKVPAALLNAELRIESMVAVLDEASKQMASSLKPGIGRFTALLEVVGVPVTVSKEVRDRLYELSKLRNLIVHQFGVADERFVRECPTVKATAGERVMVSYADYRTYGRAARDFAIVVLQAANRSEIALSKKPKSITVGASPSKTKKR